MADPFVAGERLTAARLNEMRTPGAWVPWTPGFTGLTVGNGTLACAYFVSGNFVAVRIYFAMGTTSVMGSPISNLPFPGNGAQFGGGQIATYRDVSATADYDGIFRIAGGNSIYWLIMNKAGANDSRVHVAATVPFTWAVGDIASGYLMYERG
jgi:hypothetical protein